nr:hypothetical protein GCM10020092_104970 [Actinoplanes digitatis]
MVLPDKEVTTDLGAPYAGAGQFFSGNADDLNNSLSKSIDLTGKTTSAVTLKGRYDIEADYDYLYFEASEDNGATWTRLNGTINGAAFPTDASNTPALTGSTGGAWADIAVPLNAYAGKKITFRLHYLTDGGVSEGGFFGDDITVTADGATVSTDGAEGTTTWTLSGFTIVGASSTKLFDNFYIAGHRSYVSYDKYLKTGPYFFGYQLAKPDYVDHYAYQEGLLISYWDTSQVDNNTNVHPGSGRNLIIDSRAGAVLQPRGPAVARPHPGVRRAVQPEEGRLVHAAHQRQGQLHPWPGRAAAVRRHQEVLLLRAAEPGRPAPGRRREGQGCRRERHLHQGQDQLIHR